MWALMGPMMDHLRGLFPGSLQGPGAHAINFMTHSWAHFKGASMPNIRPIKGPVRAFLRRSKGQGTHAISDTPGGLI